jgi:hypothetical protein
MVVLSRRPLTEHRTHHHPPKSVHPTPRYLPVRLLTPHTRQHQPRKIDIADRFVPDARMSEVYRTVRDPRMSWVCPDEEVVEAVVVDLSRREDVLRHVDESGWWKCSI